ncbi:hypothetical protein NW762_012857 [Fusarium torreyae]|uniref:RING-type domain-containing protein n=1 Tax=Fusarium torreyae TaxID=1237075 RepID=A0A9W8RPN4_9HYPO|nr:hypothetical protein NW762_012857 [Fusarium torreyae]
MSYTVTEMKRRCNMCLEDVGSGPKLRHLASGFLLCDSCASTQNQDDHQMVQQCGWDDECPVCLESQRDMVFLACFITASADSATLTGHTVCSDCTEMIGIRRSEASADFLPPSETVRCPWCRGMVIHAVRAVSDVIVIDEPESESEFVTEAEAEVETEAEIEAEIEAIITELFT